MIRVTPVAFERISIGYLFGVDPLLFISSKGREHKWQKFV